MKKYELRKNSIEVSFKNRRTIKEGATLTQDERFPEIVATFDDMDSAREELKKYKTSITKFSGNAGAYYLVEEFYIEENTYDEKGEWIEGGDIWEFSKITIELVEKPSYTTIASFDNMEDAEKAYNDYDGENEVYLSF